ncbi:uncharacterized protein B0I36DRAFT_40837 [Microdochium trichocladiopsis]|uniref:Uncharacterized protein n=1 Tax=Microdochium trichocladiopsis TaxID=1682393 RepID=A0A9P8XUX8_9PEZI|nr:uncharacterized protein B0I36DRAFT_40837 [Microdochium trichocladiopsis]KAH7018563.1 hypothetical protein B0I36DRAFT_40837 [Microdochium trichocladiopsis]
MIAFLFRLVPGVQDVHGCLAAGPSSGLSKSTQPHISYAGSGSAICLLAAGFVVGDLASPCRNFQVMSILASAPTGTPQKIGTKIQLGHGTESSNSVIELDNPNFFVTGKRLP